MRGRYRQTYLAKDYQQVVVAKKRCITDGTFPYKPLLRIVDFSSRGFRTALMSWVAGRPLQLLSTPELDACYYFHADPGLVQVYEQCALDPDATREIARSLNIRHPATRDGDVIMSTDLVLDFRHNGLPLRRAFSVKRERDLSRRVVEKFEIERQYWSRRGVECKLLLDTYLPRTVVDNMRLVFARHDPVKVPIPSAVPAVCAWLGAYVSTSTEPIATLCGRCDGELRLPRGTSLAVCYHLIVRRTFLVDYTHPILPRPRFLAVSAS